MLFYVSLNSSEVNVENIRMIEDDPLYHIGVPVVKQILNIIQQFSPRDDDILSDQLQELESINDFGAYQIKNYMFYLGDCSSDYSFPDIVLNLHLNEIEKTTLVEHITFMFHSSRVVYETVRTLKPDLQLPDLFFDENMCLLYINQEWTRCIGVIVREM